MLDSDNLDPSRFLVPDPASGAWVALRSVTERGALTAFLLALQLDCPAEWVDVDCLVVVGGDGGVEAAVDEAFAAMPTAALRVLLEQRKVLQVWGFALEVIIRRQGAASGSLSVSMWNSREVHAGQIVAPPCTQSALQHSVLDPRLSRSTLEDTKPGSSANRVQSTASTNLAETPPPQRTWIGACTWLRQPGRHRGAAGADERREPRGARGL